MATFLDLVDLASENLGGAVLAASDEFFAPKENLIKAGEAQWIPDKYTDRGKWMDGWESRRRRGPGHDWVIIRLGLPGIVRGVVVDTRHFRGNYPESCSVDICSLPGNAGIDEVLDDYVPWQQVLGKSKLEGHSQNKFEISDDGAGNHRATHLRLNIYPDGGVARLRVHGEVTPDWGPHRFPRRSHRPGFGRARRPGPGAERHVLRQQRQPGLARSGAKAERRLGNPAPARNRPRLGHRQTGNAWYHRASRGRHHPLHRQRPGYVQPRSVQSRSRPRRRRRLPDQRLLQLEAALARGATSGQRAQLLRARAHRH